MVSEVCQKIDPKLLLVRDSALVPRGLKPQEIVEVTDEVLAKIAGTPTPEGILAEIPMPAHAELEGKKRILALDGISDPGNVGTLLRTAFSFGWDATFLFHDCCDPYNDKALRAAKGATFHLPMRMGSWTELQAVAKKGKLPLFAADLNGKAVTAVTFPAALILVLGSEAHGLSKEAKEGCERITIPQTGAMDSLNVAVAGGILMYLVSYERKKA
jgi:TrmH family RNA methyltransferase